MTQRLSRTWVLVFFTFLIANIAGADQPSPKQCKNVGRAIIAFDSDKLATLADGSDPFSEAILKASLLIATAEGNETAAEKTANQVSLPDEFLKRTALSMVLETPNPELVSVDTYREIKRSRRALLIATLSGSVADCKRIRSGFDSAKLPEHSHDALVDFSMACESLCGEFQSTPLRVCIGLAQAQSRETNSSALAIYRAADPEQKALLASTRGDESNHYSLLIAKEQERAKLVTAYTGLYKAYLEGAKTKIEVMKGMQEIQSTALDLKEKRVTQYWTMRNLRSERFAKQRESAAASRARAEQEASLNSANLSAVWPSIFEHRSLRPTASRLRQSLRSYTPSNSGSLSICYAKCRSSMDTLNKLLSSEIDGISLNQRANLKRYLRKLDSELQKNYSATSYVVSLNESPATDRSQQTDKATFASHPPTMAGQESMKIALTGDDISLAQLALYQSLVKALIRAGKTGDKQQLAGLAASIRNSDLLSDDHKNRLNKIGSRAFAGKMSAADLAQIESPRLVLQEISGVSGDSKNPLVLPENYVASAFDLLISHTMDSETGN